MHSGQWTRLWPSTTLRIVDEIALRFKDPLKRYRWRRVRKRVLNEWSPSGFTFIVEERQAQPVPDQFAVTLNDFVYGALRVVRGDGWGTMRFHLEDDDTVASYITGGLIGIGPAFDVNRKWQSWRGTFSHELGHVLGLKHRDWQLNLSVMEAYRVLYPDQHDLDSVREMYTA